MTQTVYLTSEQRIIYDYLKSGDETYRESYTDMMLSMSDSDVGEVYLLIEAEKRAKIANTRYFVLPNDRFVRALIDGWAYVERVATQQMIVAASIENVKFLKERLNASSIYVGIVLNNPDDFIIL